MLFFKTKFLPFTGCERLIVTIFRSWVECLLSNDIKSLPKKSQMKTFLKSRGDLKPCWKTCSRAQTRPYSPHRRRVRLPLCRQQTQQENICRVFSYRTAGLSQMTQISQLLISDPVRQHITEIQDNVSKVFMSLWTISCLQSPLIGHIYCKTTAN